MKYRPLDRPERIPEVFVQAWNERDAHRLASVFDEDAEFVNVTGLWWHDREAIERAHAYGLTHIFDRSTLELVQTRVKRLTDTAAVVHARMRLPGQTSVADVEHPRLRTTHFSFVAHLARPMVAIVAVMRKLVHSIYGVFKHDQASDGGVLPHSSPSRSTYKRAVSL